ncbi:putative Serine/threonine-protein kinase bri1 [Heracleum sosnowskyi]|uniref:Serine/threonine-protein kinase bri1 n=1 Tax=Heracleum sosnowskyi TaxID=360622 RepID=A0AAD8GZU6_9APIA|nr:putative Serine/threonine-protein kinase bri1 [Heracleum sosnowskyi]
MDTIRLSLAQESFSNTTCSGIEMEALYGFKQGLRDPSGRLSYWTGADCCQWSGIECDMSGNVIKIDLRNPFPSTTYESSCLGGLASIKYLNMGNAELRGQGPEMFQALNMLPSLKELHLRSCNLDNLTVSLSYVNFTLLSVLDLSDNYIRSSIPKWIFNLTSLTKLDLSNNYMDYSGTIPRECGDKASKEDPDPLLYYGIEGRIPGELGSLCGLEVLKLSGNLLTGELDEFLDSFTTVCTDNSLVTLSLSGNQLTGSFPNSLGKLKYLKQLHVSHNCFWGSIPETIGNLSFLQELDVSINEMNGTIPRTLGKLSHITSLNLENNHWEGVLTEDQLLDLKSLQYLIVSTDGVRSLVFNVTPEWNPPFRLLSLELYNCIVGPRFPAWIRIQSKLNFVILQNTGIEDTIPEEWFASISSQVTHLELSDNKIKGKLPQMLKFPELETIDLRKNRFEGSLPHWFTNATNIFLQKNLFSGPFPDYISELTQLKILDVSENLLTGVIPTSLCTMTYLEILSLRVNQFSGKLPKCWNDFQLLNILDIASNNLSGEIPSSMGLLINLNILSLSNNSLSGKIPLSLQNCMGLQSLDLGDNKFSGNLPLWIGLNLTELFIVRLRSNKLSGTIPEQWCNLSNLHILDLAENSLSGVIPSCLGKLRSLTHTTIGDSNNWGRYSFEEQMFMLTKGREMVYSGTLKFVKIIDVSSNNLTGNPSLCGKPLLFKCPDSDASSDVPMSQYPDEDSETEIENLLFYCCGFVSGICGVWCTLWKKDKWREAYFRFFKLA